MKKIILCFLLSSFSSLLATESTELDDKLRAEMQKLRGLSQNLELHLPKSSSRSAEIVEDTLNLRSAAIQRDNQANQKPRTLVQEDIALESLSLDELENPAFKPTQLNKRRVRSR